MNNQNSNSFLSGSPGTTDVSSVVTGAIGLLTTIILYLGILPLAKGTYMYSLLMERGKIQHSIMLLFFWSVAILVFKAIKLTQQQASFKLNVIPSDIKKIGRKDADKILDNLKNIDSNPRNKILLNRIWIALEHFKSQGKVEKVDEILQYQGEVDLEIMESSYTIFKVFIWAIPILGFIGTVLGIGTAVGGFSEFTKAALEIEQIKGALDVVTGGLSTAFDTTLLGLVCALVLMLPGTALQKMEGAFLIAIEKFCMDNLLNRFQGQSAPSIVGEVTEEGLTNRFKQAIEETFDSYTKMLQESLQAWSGGFGAVLEGVTGQSKHIGEQLTAVQPIAEGFKQSMASFSNQMENTARQQNEMMQGFASQVSNLQPMIGSLSEISNSLSQERKDFQNEVNNWMQNLDRVGGTITSRIADQNQQVLAKLNEFTNTAAQERRDFQAEVNNWMQNLERVGTSVISKIAEQQQQDVSSQNQQLQQLLQTFNNLIGKEEEIIAMINKTFAQIAASDTMFKDTLDGIMKGLRDIKPALEQLARPKQIRFIEE